jgi:hypothetical protein
MATIARQGAPVIKAHLEHLVSHGQTDLYNQAIEYLLENTIPIPDHKPPERRERAASRETCPPAAGRMGEGICPPQGPPAANPFAGCPGSAARSITRPDGVRGMSHPLPGGKSASELRQWPVQLTLMNPAAPYFDNADLLISADCVPFAYAGFHEEILKGKILVVFCPKLDSDIEGYIDKLAEIFTRHAIRSITIARMEVPCCGGVRYVVEKALGKAGKKIPVEEKIFSIRGGME